MICPERHRTKRWIWCVSLHLGLASIHTELEGRGDEEAICVMTNYGSTCVTVSFQHKEQYNRNHVLAWLMTMFKGDCCGLMGCDCLL